MAAHRSAVDEARAIAELDCAPIMVVRLDSSARITHANEAWRKFLRICGSSAPSAGVGLAYLDVARELSQAGAEAAARVLEQLPAAADCECLWEYRCYVERAIHWFRLEGKRLEDGVVLMHIDITPQRRAEAFLRIQGIVSSALAERKPLVASCRQIAATTSESMGWDVAAVWVPSHWEQLLCADVWSDARFRGSELETITRTTTFERGQGLPGRVWESQRPSWVSDIAANDRFPWLQRAAALDLKTAFAVPIACDGQVFAVLEFFSTASRPEERTLVELLLTAGYQLGADELRARALVRAERAEAGARLDRSRFEAVAENVPGFIVMVDRSGSIQFINRVLAHRRRDEVIGSHWTKQVPSADHPAIAAKLAVLFETGAPQRHDLTVFGPDSRELFLSVHMGAMREDGQIVGAVMSLQDMTELRRTQAEFAAAQRWVSVGTLAAGMAHEINTPIQFVSDNIHFIGDATRHLLTLTQKLGLLPELVGAGAPPALLQEAAVSALRASKAARREFLEREVPKAVACCIDGVDRVSSIVRSLAELAQPASVEKEPADINRLIERVLVVVQNEYQAVANLETSLGDLPPVRCHPHELSQVFLNLITNAAHAIGDVVKDGGALGTLSIRTWCDTDHATIAVEDTGTGIPEAIRPRIFDPFFTTKGVGQGKGQGLSHAWAVVQHHHQGTLTFESSVGKGTTFFVRLPIA